MASARNGSPQHELRLIVDYGTKNLSIGAQVGRIGENPDPGNTIILKLQEGKEEITQMVGYVERHGALQFVWGCELSRLLSSKKDAVTVVGSFQRLKVALLGASQQAKVSRDHLEKALSMLKVPEKTAEDLFVRHLVALKSALYQAAANQFHDASLSITALPAYVFFAVPEMVHLGNRHKLSQLLARAELPRTKLIPETEAASAWHAFKFGKENPASSDKLFARGDELLVADAGGWTFNASSYIITGPSEDGARIGMKATGRKDTYTITTRQPLGSELITVKFINEVYDRMSKKYLDPLAQLGITQYSLEHSLSRDFESYKINFESEGNRTFIIKGTTTGLAYRETGKIPTWSIELKREDVSRWLDQTLEKMISSVVRVRSARTKVMSMTGGFSPNTYVFRRLKEHYGNLGIVVIDSGKDAYGSADLAVVRGAAARFNVETSDAPFKYALGMPQDEWWDKELHPDIPEGSKAIIRLKGHDPYVEGRWKTLLPLGQLVTGRGTTTHSCWLEFFFDEEAFEFTKKIYFTEAAIEEHADMYPNGKLRKGIMVYDEIKFGIALDQVKRMMKLDSGDDRKTKAKNEYHAGFLFTIETDSMDVSMKLARTPDGYSLYRHFYEDTGELVPRNMVGVGESERTQVQRIHAPPLEDMIPVAMTTLLDSKFRPELQRKEGRA